MEISFKWDRAVGMWFVQATHESKAPYRSYHYSVAEAYAALEKAYIELSVPMFSNE